MIRVTIMLVHGYLGYCSVVLREYVGLEVIMKPESKVQQMSRVRKHVHKGTRR